MPCIDKPNLLPFSNDRAIQFTHDKALVDGLLRFMSEENLSQLAINEHVLELHTGRFRQFTRFDKPVELQNTFNIIKFLITNHHYGLASQVKKLLACEYTPPKRT